MYNLPSFLHHHKSLYHIRILQHLLNHILYPHAVSGHSPHHNCHQYNLYHHQLMEVFLADNHLLHYRFQHHCRISHPNNLHLLCILLPEHQHQSLLKLVFLQDLLQTYRFHQNYRFLKHYMVHQLYNH